MRKLSALIALLLGLLPLTPAMATGNDQFFYDGNPHKFAGLTEFDTPVTFTTITAGQCMSVDVNQAAVGVDCPQMYLNASPTSLPVHIEAFGPTTIQPNTSQVFTYAVPFTGNPVCTVSSTLAAPVLSFQIPPGTGQVIVQNYSGSVITQAEVICVGR
jgi:hypothetical protein